MTDNYNKVSGGLLLDGRYKLLRPLSSDGGTADVWLALDTNTIDEVYDGDNDSVSSKEESGIKVAIKIYRPKNALDLGEQRFREEYKIVFNCHHSNLLQPINFSIFEGVPYLVLPYCKNGSSEVLLGKISDKDELWRYIGDVASGLAYLHDFNPTIVHHDIKPANILVDEKGNFVITDFGISSHKGGNRDGYDESQSGTMAYMAPERFDDQYESIPESDIWSLGATLFELITGKVPFGDDGGFAQTKALTQEIPPITASVPNDIKRLIHDCLSVDPAKRPTAKQIIRAAEIKTYPLKNRKLNFILGGAVALLAIVALIIALISVKEVEEPIVQSVTLTNEEVFTQAMQLLGTPDADALRQGLDILDSLGKLNYVPALYEQAFTYGWYSDSISLARKDLLGIDYYPQSSIDKYLPISQAINTKAVGLLTKIEELNDPDYPEINAQALYRLACYYHNDTLFKRDDKRALALLENARMWALRTSDKKLLKRIDDGIILMSK